MAGEILRSCSPHKFMKTKPRKRKLTKIQMRVAIARDVIKQLNTNLLDVTQGVYLDHHHGPFQGVGCGVDAQPLLLQPNRRPCTVCAIGAGFVALVRLENNYITGDRVSYHERLWKYFTGEQINVIEQLFEAWYSGDGLEPCTPVTRLRWIWSYVARHPKFTSEEIKVAAERFGKRHNRKGNNG